MAQTANRRSEIGVGALVVSLIGLVVLSFLPTPYVIQRPGPVYDTLGTALASDGSEVPLIQVNDAESYPTMGGLNLTTVEVVGNRERPPSWFELARAWVDPARAVVPMDLVYPLGVTAEDRTEQNAILMDESQSEAKAAALRELGYDVPTEIEIVELVEDSASAGVLEAGDMLRAFNGMPLTSTPNLKSQLQDNGAEPVMFTLLRDGDEKTVTVTPTQSTQGETSTWVIGAYVLSHYDFPVDVTIQLDNVGGPSAGLMFTLGIIDELTPGALTGGEVIAGTGTITSEGLVGPIGGIRQKLHGARNAGATYFFAPEYNCAEALGYIPDGLQVVRVATLDDALDAISVIAESEDTSNLPACTLP